MTLGLRYAVFPFACLALGAAASGCASPDAAPEDLTTENAVATDEAIVADFRRDLGRLAHVAAVCQNDQSDECITRALDDAGDVGTEAFDPSLHAEGIQQQLEWIGSLTKSTICSRIAFMTPYAQRFNAAVRIYYVIGGALSAAIIGGATAGVETVWELNAHQNAVFAYGGGGVGNVIGGGGAVYNAFAISGLGGDVLSNWSGRFYGGGVTIAFPETEIGADVIGFHDGNGTRGVVGIGVGASIGINLLNPGVTVNVNTTNYTPWDTATRAINGRGSFSHFGSSGGHTYRQFHENYGFSAGAIQALDILWYGQSQGQISAAITAYGTDKLREAGQTLVSWCAAGQGARGVAAAPATSGTQRPTPMDGPAVACTEDGDCGSNAVCATNTTGAACCRATFDAPDATACYSNADCPSGQICSRGARTSADEVKYTCMDPTAHPCTDGKP